MLDPNIIDACYEEAAGEAAWGARLAEPRHEHGGRASGGSGAQAGLPEPMLAECLATAIGSIADAG